MDAFTANFVDVLAMKGHVQYSTSEELLCKVHEMAAFKLEQSSSQNETFAYQIHLLLIQCLISIIILTLPQ